MQDDGPDLGTLLGIGIATAAFLVVGMGVGWLIDRLVATSPVFTLIGLAIGMVGVGAYIYAQFKRFLP